MVLTAPPKGSLILVSSGPQFTKMPTRVGDEVEAEDWFFLSKRNALTKSLSLATSDETAGVEELVPTLARD
nr:hypothetical protein [Tanacetum cinerariifolium]